MLGQKRKLCDPKGAKKQARGKRGSVQKPFFRKRTI